MQNKVRVHITGVKVNAPTYTNVTFTPSLINFFYGKNGTGKSTLAKAFKDGSAVLTWNGAPFPDERILVYNEDFIAKNENDFSGGSSREVKVVAEEDLASLKESLKEELLKEGREKLAKTLGERKKLISESIEEEIIAEDYDHQAGDEAEEFSLSLKLELKGLVFKEEDLNKLIEERLKPKITAGFILGEEREVDFSYQESDGEGQVFEAKIKASLYPSIDEEEVKKKLKGKRPAAAIDYLGLLPSVEDYEINMSPRLPNFLLTLPHREERIKIEVKTKQ